MRMSEPQEWAAEPRETAEAEQGDPTEESDRHEDLTLTFLAEAKAVRDIRRWTRSHFEIWGMPWLADAAELCVSELVTNVITHIGEGTPATLQLVMTGPSPLIALTDPAPRLFPRR